MTLVPDGVAFAPRTVEEVAPAVLRHLPDAVVTSDEINCFDASVTVTHGDDARIGVETAYAIARDLRGGLDVDRGKATDWHVRAFGPETGRTHPDVRTGTRFWLSRTYAVPSGYNETSTDLETIEPPASGRRE